MVESVENLVELVADKLKNRLLPDLAAHVTIINIGKPEFEMKLC